MREAEEVERLGLPLSKLVFFSWLMHASDDLALGGSKKAFQM
jgi:hypothetical protein